MALIDELLPAYDVRQRHAVGVRAPGPAVYAAVRRLELGGSGTIRRLFRLRGLPAEAVDLRGLLRLGFVLLGEQPGDGIALGLAGRFWRPSGDLLRLDPAAFRRFCRQGYAKAVWAFEVRQVPGGTELSTETRVLCFGVGARRAFRLYWALVGPWSAWVRRSALRRLARTAEAAAGGGC